MKPARGESLVEDIASDQAESRVRPADLFLYSEVGRDHTERERQAAFQHGIPGSRCLAEAPFPLKHHGSDGPAPVLTVPHVHSSSCPLLEPRAPLPPLLPRHPRGSAPALCPHATRCLCVTEVFSMPPLTLNRKSYLILEVQEEN